MSKRFTEPDKWRDPWFRKLPPHMKLLWIYLVDHCDKAGYIHMDWEIAMIFIGHHVEESHLEAFGHRVEKLGPDRYWLPTFIGFQYGKLSKDCRPHQCVFDALAKLKKEFPSHAFEETSDRVCDRVSDTLLNKDNTNTVHKQRQSEYPKLEEWMERVSKLAVDDWSRDWWERKWYSAEKTGWLNGSKQITNWQAHQDSLMTYFRGDLSERAAKNPPTVDIDALERANAAQRKKEQAEVLASVLNGTRE